MPGATKGFHRAVRWAKARYGALRAGITPATLVALTVAFVAADAGSELAGSSLFPGGPLDEIAHLLTTLLICWAIGGAVYRRLLTPALIASVAIDLDHIPGRLGWNGLTVGTPRPYTHSLLTVVLVLGLSLVWPRRREMLLGVAVGLLLHFFRDMAEPDSGVALLWPASTHSFSFPHGAYLALMAAAVAVGSLRSFRWRRVVRDPPLQGARQGTPTGDRIVPDETGALASSGGH